MFGWGVPFVLYLKFFDVGIDALDRVALKVGCSITAIIMIALIFVRGLLLECFLLAYG